MTTKFKLPKHPTDAKYVLLHKAIKYHESPMDVAEELDYQTARVMFSTTTGPKPITIFTRPDTRYADYRPLPEDQFEAAVRRYAYDRINWFTHAGTDQDRQVLTSGTLSYAQWQARYLNVFDDFIVPDALTQWGIDGKRRVTQVYRLLRFFWFVPPEIHVFDTQAPKGKAAYALCFNKSGGRHFYVAFAQSVKDKVARRKMELFLAGNTEE